MGLHHPPGQLPVFRSGPRRTDHFDHLLFAGLSDRSKRGPRNRLAVRATFLHSPPPGLRWRKPPTLANSSGAKGEAAGGGALGAALGVRGRPSRSAATSASAGGVRSASATRTISTACSVGWLPASASQERSSSSARQE